MILHLLDLKQFMYTGVSKKGVCSRGVIEDSGYYRSREFICGSLAYVICEIYNIMRDPNNRICFCIDTTPTYKRELSETKLNRRYKDGRAKAPVHVDYQFKFAQQMLEACNIDYVRVEGYEADDCISSVVYKYYGMFRKIVIHSNDSDQYYLVDDKVSVVPTSLKGKSINMSNWSATVIKNMYTPYNTITIMKMINGESGDNIPAIDPIMAKRILKLLPDISGEYYGNNDILRTLIKNSTGDDGVTMAIFDLIAPVVIKDSRIIIDITKKINVSNLTYFGVEFGAYCYTKMNYQVENKEMNDLIEDFLDYLVEEEVI